MRYLFEDKNEVSKLLLPEGYVPLYGVSFGYKATEAPLNGPKRNMDVVSYIV